MPLVYTVCAKRQLIGQFPNDQQMGPSRFHQYFFILPEIENIAQKVLLLICIYRRLELGVGRNNLVRLKGRRRLR